MHRFFTQQFESGVEYERQDGTDNCVDFNTETTVDKPNHREWNLNDDTANRSKKRTNTVAQPSDQDTITTPPERIAFRVPCLRQRLRILDLSYNACSNRNSCQRSTGELIHDICDIRSWVLTSTNRMLLVVV